MAVSWDASLEEVRGTVISVILGPEPSVFRKG